ncbi:hypothetical protein [Massilia phyllosphaerae]|uniref:hypothetical protein n=1 Tax=Massilia phyllosphaerae TaxID=3106034 RepID=UPI002B1CD80F|nr:hypothetical protein [Massilia sp. SGZ-792]
MSLTKTQLAAKVYRQMIEPQLNGASIVGNIVVDVDSRQLLADLADAQMTLEDVSEGQPDGAVVQQLEVDVPRGLSNFFAKDWDDLLQSHKFLTIPPDEFYVAADDYLSSEGKEFLTAERYKSTIALAQLIQDVADFKDISDDEMKCIFLQPAKLEILITYSAKDLRSTPGLDELAEEFGTSAKKHKDQRKVILKVVLNEMLGNVREENRFSQLLSEFREFKRRVQDSYELYVAEFSFEKVLEEVQAHKLDYTIKLNKVFSDIQNQLLAVPAALILIGGQLKESNGFSWHNVVIMFGCLVFVVFMDLLVRNQYNTLNAVHSEIVAQENNWIRKHDDIYDRFAKPYADLEKRYRHQKYLIRIVDVLVACTFLIATALFFWNSTPTTYWLKLAVMKWV